MHVRVLTAADLHQSRLHYRRLALAVKEQKPNVVALVGDALHFGDVGKYQFGLECAVLLADLPVNHLIFVRGNHEDANWTGFVRRWPFDRRPLTLLYGTACSIGPLTIVGFPCSMGDEEPWCNTLPEKGNEIHLGIAEPARTPLPESDSWLPDLMRLTGPAGRALWLMHQAPMALPLSRPDAFNPRWQRAIERFSPLLTISGHDHESPLESGAWLARWQETTCVNVGQAELDFHHCLVDFEFPNSKPCLPTKVTLHAFPQDQTVEIFPTQHKP